MEENEKKSFEYAAVYLLDAPYFLDRRYDYFIPIDLRDKITAGCFVTVPFGRGNRRQMAVVRELHHCPSAVEIKTLSEICNDRPILSEESLALCDYMKEQCLCTFGEAVRSNLPQAALGKMTAFYIPTAKKAPNTSSGFSPADLFVYEYILQSGGRTGEAVKVKFGAAVAEESLTKLCGKGILQKELFSGKTMSGLFENYYFLAIDEEKCQALIDGSGKEKLRSAKHKQILTLLLSSTAPLSSDDICRECDCTAVQLKALCEKGYIDFEQKRLWRQSYIDESAEAKATPHKLNEEQQAAADQVKAKLHEEKAGAFLLYGVTGSGKTSVILSAIDEALSMGKGVIMLLPEIALTPQTLKIFSSRYGEKIALVHSGLAAGERYDAHMKLRAGEAKLVIGTRSAIFSPVQNLGLVIIDEEHETTYKSDTSPKYHARDIARWRCAYNGAVLLLSSATPSIESYSKAKAGKYTLLQLKERYGNAVLPEVVVYDMRNELRSGNTSPIGRVLREEIQTTAERGEQSVLFLNRRGYHTAVSCKSCGEVITCPHCSIAMHYHTKKGSYDQGFLFCHWCGQKLAVPEKCPSCDSEHLVKTGFGTQKLEKELAELLPGKTVLRMDADSTSQKHSLDEMLTAFKEHRGDLLLGTQMVTKGHDFPDVTLVGVLLADMSLYMDDYHANERTFSMLTQVIGRAGRSEKKGKAVIQTNNPDNDTIRLACRQDYEAFYNSEIRLRKLLVFPPYCDIVLMTLTCADEKQVLIAATRLREELENQLKTGYSDVEMIIFGPFESPVFKVEEKYRMRLVIKCRLNKRSRALFSELLSGFGKTGKEKIALSIDFNPSGL